MNSIQTIKTEKYWLLVNKNSKPEEGVWFYWYDSDGETVLIEKSIGVSRFDIRDYWKAKSDNEYGYGDWSEDYGHKILGHLPIGDAPLLEGVPLLMDLPEQTEQ